MSRVLIAGCGYVGGRLAELLAERGDEVWGMRRDHRERRPSGGVRSVTADVTDPASLGELPGDVDALVYAVAPSGRSDEAYRAAYVDGLGHVLDALAGDPDGSPFSGRVVVVTSTGVYGETDGSRVDEMTEPRPADATGERLLEAEAIARVVGAPGVAVRLGGIYGPGRTRTIRRVVEGEAPCPPPGRYGNRIHRDDAAGILRHLLDLPDPGPVYVGVDRDPAELREVYRWIAGRAGVVDPCAGADGGAGADEPTEARGRRGTNKRCVSDRVVASGYRFRYPTFREGYGELLEEEVGNA